MTQSTISYICGDIVHLGFFPGLSGPANICGYAFCEILGMTKFHSCCVITQKFDIVCIVCSCRTGKAKITFRQLSQLLD